MPPLLFCCVDGPRTGEEAAAPQSAIVHTRHVRIRAVSTKTLKTAHTSKSCPNGRVKPGPWKPLPSPNSGLNYDLRDKPLCPQKTDMHPAVSRRLRIIGLKQPRILEKLVRTVMFARQCWLLGLLNKGNRQMWPLDGM